MKFTIARAALAMLMAGAIAGCGGGGSSTPATPANLDARIAAAAADPANDTATNSSSAFKALQDIGIPAMVVPASGSVQINFTVFSDGTVKSGLTNANARIAIAKLVPGTNGDIDQWVNYISRTETATAGVGPGGSQTPPATARQATTDSSTAASLVYNPDGYYTYTMTTDIRDPAQTMGVVFEPNRTHRVAIQLDYKNAAGETVRVNPYFDITFDANGNAVPVTDPNQTRVMADVASCNNCHGKLATHGGGRVDVQFCVLCHNPGTTDANSGNVLTLQTMVHKIHAGRLLKQALDAGAGGEDYVIWGFRDSKNDYAEVGFPQDLRNCSVCHTGANPKTPQGDNWKSRPSKEACLTCHANNAGSTWDTQHAAFASALIGPTATAKDLTNAQCNDCHRAGSAIGADRVHFNQIQINAAKYKVNIESATYDAGTRAVTVNYSVTDPTNGDAPYNLVTPDCGVTNGVPTCANTTKFGNLRFYLGYQNLIGQPGPTDWTAWGNGGSGANAYLYTGTNDGSNHYTVTIPVPADVAGISQAQGSARVVSIGQVKEPPLLIKSATDPRPVASFDPADLLNVGVQHTYADVALSGPLQPRRTIVATDKCNVCHGLLGTASGSNTLANAFHGGARNTVEACPVCHDANRASANNIMTNGLALYESFQAKRFIHGIHSNAFRTYPFAHGNKGVGAFNKDGTPIAPWTTPMTSTAENYALEVHWPDGNGINCNACHVNDSQLKDQSRVGSMVLKPAGVTDPLQWLAISPKAATCTSCHDGTSAKVGPVLDHVMQWGGAGFADLSTPAMTQAGTWQTIEVCDDCHAPGSGPAGIDRVHNVK